MSNMTKISAIAAAAAIAFVSTQALAGSVTSSASVTITSPITVSETAALSFGSISSGTTAGTVVVSPAGAPTFTGGVSDFGGGATNAAFSVTGTGNASYTVSVDPSATLSNGIDNMTVNTFTSDLTGFVGALSAGTSAFNLGATLNVAANQADGAYSGTYNVTVNYQ